jgi:putative nucleotidyltransferase-like protein
MTEGEFLLECLKQGGGQDVVERLECLTERQWANLRDAAVWHGVAPLLFTRVRTLLGDEAEAPIDSGLRDFHSYCTLHNSAIREDLVELLAQADARGYGVLALKGAYLAFCVYDDPGARGMHDIDLLVETSQIERFGERLARLGYTYTEALDQVDDYHLPSMVRDGSSEVELHRDLVPDHASFQVDIEQIWARATSTRSGGMELPHPAPDDVLLHICIHTAFNHEFMLGLRGACDIDALVEKFGSRLDWTRFVDTANGSGCSRYVFAALSMANQLLNTAVPPEVMGSLLHDAADDAIAAEIAVFVMNSAEAVPVTVIAVREAGTGFAKLRALWRGVFPPPDVLRRIYSIDQSTLRLLLYYAVRPLDLVLRRGRQVFGLVAGSGHERSMVTKELRRQRIRTWARQ